MALRGYEGDTLKVFVTDLGAFKDEMQEEGKTDLSSPSWYEERSIQELEPKDGQTRAS